MLVLGVFFWQVVLAVHIAGVVVAFGVMFAYPLIEAVAARQDPRAMPWYHRTQSLIGQRLIAPGLLVVLAAGIYLASKLHQWHAFYTMWGLGAVILIGALGGVYFGPREKRLAELAERDIAATAPGEEVSFGPEYRALQRQVGAVGAVAGLVVLVTVYLMTVQAGA